MRPRLRSYGLSSMATRSPGRMRMKFFRMRPETCARTWCLFSSSTLNIALGNVSTTVAITSIASSFDKPCPLETLLRQNHSAFGCHRYGVLEMSAQASIFCDCRPAVAQYLHARLAYVHHRLDSQDHSCT